MTDDSINPAVEKLLALGEPKYARDFDWPDYCTLVGITREHIPDLIEIATDQALFSLNDDNDPRVWAPVHAWRALGQLQAVEAIRPLMQLMHEVKDNDWIIEEIPGVFGMIGLEAYHPLVAYFQDERYPVYSRLVAATGILQIALVQAEVRQQSIEILSQQLEKYAENRPGMNSVLIVQLVELGAAEKADLIHKVFAAGKVDRFIAGDWRDVKNRLNHPGEPPVRQKRPLSKTTDAATPDSGPRSAANEPRTGRYSRPTS